MAAIAVSAPGREHRWPAIPANALSIPFGLTGLAATWRAAQPIIRSPAAVANALFIVAAAVWAVLIALYLAQGYRHLVADLRHPVMAPFVPLATIVAMILGSALATVAFAAGRIIVVIALAATFLLGGWLMGEWIIVDIDSDCLHPGYFLPTVAGEGVGAYTAAAVHLHQAAEASIWVAAISWLLLSATVLNRLLIRRPLPNQLEPTLAIEVAAPAVVGVGYFAVDGGAMTTVAYALGGYAAFMLVAQLRLVPLYARLRFSIGFWAFTFSYAIVGTLALRWIALTRVPGGTGYAFVVLVLVTALIAAIAGRSVIAMKRGQFFPAHPRPGPGR